MRIPNSHTINLPDGVCNPVRIFWMLRPSAALSCGDPPGNEVSSSQRLRDMAVDGEFLNHLPGRIQRQPGSLDKHVGNGFHRAKLLDELPFPGTTRHFGEKGIPDGRHVRLMPCNNQHWQSKTPVQIRHVHHIESPQCNPLEHDQLDMLCKLGIPHQFCDFFCSIGSVAADMACQYAVKTQPGIDCADDTHIASVRMEKRRVVKRDDIGKGRMLGHDFLPQRTQRGHRGRRKC